MSSLHNARVLIIDNDFRVAQQLEPILERRNFHVKSIGHDGTLPTAVQHTPNDETWLETIVNFAQQFRPHVTVVDLRLRNDYMDEESGLLVIPKVDSPFNILYSARLTFDAIERANQVDVFKCVPKGAGGTSKVIDAIMQAAQQASAEYANINIRWPLDTNSQMIARSMFGGEASIPEELCDDLVLQLYEEAASDAELSTVLEEMHNTPPASLRRSTVLKVQPANREPTILKLSREGRVRTEKHNYETYVDGQMRGSFHTRLVDSKIFWDVGGSIYSLISGQNIRSFAAHYLRSDEPDDIIKPLKHLFEEVWRGHYEKSASTLSDTRYDSLYDLYDEMYKFDKRFKDRYELSRDQWNRIKKRVHPVEWVMYNKEKSQLATAKMAITHGDLHSENIFVDGEHAWLIDFERTGPGHVLRDFVELEVDILTRLADPKLDQQSFKTLCKLLASSNSFSPSLFPVALPSSIDDSNKSIASKALKTILALREIAHKLQLFRSVSEYRWALLLNALFVAHYRRKDARQQTATAQLSRAQSMQRTRAFIYSTLLCEHLSEPGYDTSLRT